MTLLILSLIAMAIFRREILSVLIAGVVLLLGLGLVKLVEIMHVAGLGS